MSTSNRRHFRCALKLHFSTRKWYCARSVCSSIARTKVPARAVACIISYQIVKETTSTQCRDQLRHEVTKRRLKAALKLCTHVICYIWVTLRTCLWNGFPNCPGAAQHLSPSSNTPDSTRQLISKHWNGSDLKCVRKGKDRWEKNRCVSDPRHVQQRQLLKT